MLDEKIYITIKVAVVISVCISALVHLHLQTRLDLLNLDSASIHLGNLVHKGQRSKFHALFTSSTYSNAHTQNYLHTVKYTKIR